MTDYMVLPEADWEWAMLRARQATSQTPFGFAEWSEVAFAFYDQASRDDLFASVIALCPYMGPEAACRAILKGIEHGDKVVEIVWHPWRSVAAVLVVVLVILAFILLMAPAAI